MYVDGGGVDEHTECTQKKKNRSQIANQRNIWLALIALSAQLYRENMIISCIHCRYDMIGLIHCTVFRMRFTVRGGRLTGVERKGIIFWDIWHGVRTKLKGIFMLPSVGF